MTRTLPRFNMLSICIRAALYGANNPRVVSMVVWNARHPDKPEHGQ